MRKLLLSMAIGSVLLGCSYHCLRKPSEQRWDEREQIKEYIEGTWRAKGGIWITFAKDGTFQVNKGKEGKERVFDGTYSTEYSIDGPGGLIFDCIVLKIKINNPTIHGVEEAYGFLPEFSIIPVSFYSGEGDPRRLKLLQIENSFGYLLSKHFSINTQDPLWLSGENIDGGWPKYLDE